MGTRQRHEEEEEDKDERITSQASQRPHRAIHLERGDHLLLTVRPWPPHTTQHIHTLHITHTLISHTIYSTHTANTCKHNIHTNTLHNTYTTY